MTIKEYKQEMIEDFEAEINEVEHKLIFGGDTPADEKDRAEAYIIGIRYCIETLKETL